MSISIEFNLNNFDSK